MVLLVVAEVLNDLIVFALAYIMTSNNELDNSFEVYLFFIIEFIEKISRVDGDEEEEIENEVGHDSYNEFIETGNFRIKNHLITDLKTLLKISRKLCMIWGKT